MRKLVGANVARIRRERGLTQEALAELCGLSQQYLSGLERGQRNPTIVTIYEIAMALGVSHIELVQPDQQGAG
ncbi:helix-turn-helix domain-containing protein [Sphingomonas caeni]|uniref:helix-turn-helix domain-containing protein n=1 Tax=Sphingomonas caeni TaxID=2984949 RepID=UPI00387336E1